MKILQTKPVAGQDNEKRHADVTVWPQDTEQNRENLLKCCQVGGTKRVVIDHNANSDTFADICRSSVECVLLFHRMSILPQFLQCNHYYEIFLSEDTIIIHIILQIIVIYNESERSFVGSVYHCFVISYDNI